MVKVTVEQWFLFTVLVEYIQGESHEGEEESDMTTTLTRDWFIAYGKQYHACDEALAWLAEQPQDIEPLALLQCEGFKPAWLDWLLRLLFADHPLYAEYDAKRAPLDAEYAVKRDALYAEYRAKRAPLYAEYRAKRAPLEAEYDAKCAPLDAEYDAKCAPLYAEYEAKRDSLDAEYEAKRDPLDAEYEAKRALLDAEYLPRLIVILQEEQ